MCLGNNFSENVDLHAKYQHCFEITINKRLGVINIHYGNVIIVKF